MVFLSGVLIVHRGNRLDYNLAKELTQKCPLNMSLYACMSRLVYTMYIDTRLHKSPHTLYIKHSILLN